MATIGLNIIVRNEPVDRLALMIDYLKPDVSEFIITDTGSNDIEIDEPLYNSWGARVARFEWINDFAAARNHGLQYATTDYILHLDGDELPTRAMMDHIKWAVNSDEPQAQKALGWLYFTRNFWGGEHGIEVEAHWHCRLFRRDKGRWYKPLHEQVMLGGRIEETTRGTHVLPKAPKEAYLIHSKPREAIERSAELYSAMERT
jgi:glycosyltransferase involved in cell wall biosynthesis